MSIVDFFRRRELERKGLISTKKRRNQRVFGNLRSSFDYDLRYRWLMYIVSFVIWLFLAILVKNSDSLVGDRLIMAICVFTPLVLLFEFHHKFKRNSSIVLFWLVILTHLFGVYSISYLVNESWSFFSKIHGVLLLPYICAPLLLNVLLKQGSALLGAIIVIGLGSVLLPNRYMMEYFIMSAGVTGIVTFLTQKVRKRQDMLRAGFYSGVVVLLLGLTFEFIIISQDGVGVGSVIVQIFLSTIVSVILAMTISGLMPLIESIFTVTTDMSWLEMSDLNHKLLKKMQLEAPGTFHHSLVVAALSEAAAEVVGANAFMCRVASYFHDIGKLEKPEYFIENQGDHNPHDHLTPTMSALVIIAHVKDGVDLAIKHKLNPKIVDIIREHHGKSLVYYFYHKAKQLAKEEGEGAKGSEVEEKSFRYDGPLPSSKESGIICLADSVESASRTLQNASLLKIQNLVDEIVTKKIQNGHLDNTSLTINDIFKVKKSFISTLKSMTHSRISYPKDEEKTSKKKEPSKKTNEVKDLQSSNNSALK